MKIHTFRLTKGQDLKTEIEKFSEDHKIKAGMVLACVGSLEKANIRMAGVKEAEIIEGPLEIISLTGTFGIEDSHLHIAVSDQNGKVLGGHLKEKSIVRTTAEIVIGEIELPDNYRSRSDHRFDQKTPGRLSAKLSQKTRCYSHKID